MDSYPHVALLIETSNAFCRTLIEGISSFVHEHGTWSMFLDERERGAPVPKWIRHWDGDGIIVRAENEQMAADIRKTGIPAVNVSSTASRVSLPSVTVDERATAQLVVEHLRERGFKEFAFCGVSGQYWSSVREELHWKIITDAGFHCALYPTGKTRRQRWEEEQERVSEWIGSLRFPVGLIVPYDFRGQYVLDACRRAKVAVPEQVAVISQGNDQTLCDLASPPFSSVIQNAHRVGYEAAAMLQHMMNGNPLEKQKIAIEPIGIQTRRSTDALAIEDEAIASILRYIHRNACHGLRVSDLLPRISLSRRAFDYRFKSQVGHSPHTEILRVQIERIKELLIHTDLPVGEVGLKAGFEHASYMSDVFLKMVGVRPGVYRKTHSKSPQREVQP